MILRFLSKALLVFVLVLVLNCEAQPCAVPDIRDKTRNVPKVVDVIAGKDVRLTCRVKENGVITSWLKNNKTISPSDHPRTRLKLNKYLKIKGVQKDDAGYYTCVVENDCGRNTYTLQLFVGKRARTEPVVLPMDNVTVYEGENATLLCKALSDSMPHFQWLRWYSSPSNGTTNSTIEHPHYEVIKQNAQDSNQHLVLPQTNDKFDFHGMKLTLVNVTKKDEGKYTCIVGNAAGYAVELAYVIVHRLNDKQEQNVPQKNENATNAAPKFTVPPDKLSRSFLAAPVGNSVKLDCSADGHPRPTVTWYKDGARFLERKGGRRLRPWTLMLKMKDLLPTDTGKYMCNVSNAYGWINHAYYLDVHERARTEPVVLPMDNVTVYEGENATLLCKALSDSMPHFQWLRWYSSPSNGTTNSTIEHPHYEVIKQNAQDSNQHLVLTQTNDKFDFHGMKLTLVNVTKKDEGKYTCIVGNAEGYAVELAYVIVHRLYDKQEQNVPQKNENATNVMPSVNAQKEEKLGKKSARASKIQHPDILIGMLAGVIVLALILAGLCYWQAKKANASLLTAKSRRPEIDSLRAKYEVQNEYVVVPDYNRSV